MREPAPFFRHSDRMRFTKMQGVGNDFVVVDRAVLPPNTSLSNLAVQVCDRHFGIGADGLLAVSRDSPEAAFRMRMFNPDGSEDMCGNGLRCVSLWARKAGWLNGQSEFQVAALDGLRAVRFLASASEDISDGRSALLGAEMGVPQLAPESLPYCGLAGVKVVGETLHVDGARYSITVVNTGSTHTVIFGEMPDEETFQRVSPRIENHSLFPQRTSVLWAAQHGPSRFDVRIWERGAGETLGCGTGACAVGVAAILNGLSKPGVPMEIISKGGLLQITWPGENQSVDMVGPAQIVFEGEFVS